MSDIVTERIAIPGEIRISYDITGEVADTAVQQPISDEMLALVKAINAPVTEHPIVTLPAIEPISEPSSHMEAALRDGYRGQHRAASDVGAAFYAVLGILGVTYGLAVQLTPGATAMAVPAVTSLFALIVGGVLLGMTLAPKRG